MNGVRDDRLTRGDIGISIGPDGRVYFHDLDAEILEIALTVNPGDQLMRRRMAICRMVAANQMLADRGIAQPVSRSVRQGAAP